MQIDIQWTTSFICCIFAQKIYQIYQRLVNNIKILLHSPNTKKITFTGAFLAHLLKNLAVIVWTPHRLTLFRMPGKLRIRAGLGILKIKIICITRTLILQWCLIYQVGFMKSMKLKFFRINKFNNSDYKTALPNIWEHLTREASVTHSLD